MVSEQNHCRRCGNCCRQGGPALHTQDLELVRSGRLPVRSLITVRKGELAYNPILEKICPVGVELVKIRGTGRQWDCCFYDEKRGCTIYEDRPRACRVLKCWDTEKILALVEKETLTRFDILKEDDPLVAVIREHERICPCPDFEYLRQNREKLTDREKRELEKRVRNDLRFRARIIEDFDLDLNQELFYFGRPLFHLLQPLGIGFSESDGEIHLRWK